MSTDTQSIREDFRGTSMIDPVKVFGFPDVDNGAPAVMTDHPDFPNPRTSPMDEGLISDIREAGEFLDPIKLYEYTPESGDTVLILVDGKTRMTALARTWADDPNTSDFVSIPFTLVEGTPDEIRMLMLKINLDDSRKPLTALETAKHLVYMETVHGQTEEEQAKYLNKENRGGIRWIREMKKVAGLPDVVAAVEEGKIDETTAKEVAKVADPEARAEVIEQVVEAKAEGKTEREARKTATTTKDSGKGKGTEQALRGASKTTLGWKDAFMELSDFYPEAKRAVVEPLDVDAVDFNNEAQREAYVLQVETLARFRTFVKVLKLNTLKDGALFDQIESWIKSEEKESMKLVRHPDQKPLPEPKQAAAPKPPKAAKAPKAPAKAPAAKKDNAAKAPSADKAKAGASAKPATKKPASVGGSRTK